MRTESLPVATAPGEQQVSMPTLVGAAGEQQSPTPAPVGTQRQNTLIGGVWGWAPLISLSSACSMVLIAVAYNGGRAGAYWTDLPLWLGLATLFIPIAARLLSTGATRQERLGLVVLFGIGLFLVKAFQYPLYFSYHDEFIHWRTANDILDSGALFTPNSLIPVSPLFPGLEIATGALAAISGLSLFAAGSMVLGTARLILTLALYLFYERIGGSSRVAGLAALLYLSNPKLIFFDAQFSYESLALPFALLALFALTRRRASAPGWFGLTLVAFVGLGGTIVTHHLTSYALLALLLLWGAILAILRVRGAGRHEENPSWVAIVGGVAALAWLIFVANLVIGYLAPHAVGSAAEFIRLLRGESASRTLFRDPTGQVTPLWERVTALLSTAVILLGLGPGLWMLWRRYRRHGLALTLALATLAYPASLGLRLTEAGGEISARAAVTLFLGVSFVLALAVVRLVSIRPANLALGAFGVALLTITFLGNVIVGSGPIWARIPGPYVVGGDSRSVEPQGLASADWALTLLGPNNRFAADRTNRLLLGAQGEQHPVTHLNDQVDVSPLYTSGGFGPIQAAILRQGNIKYLLLDRRLSTALPRNGIYFEANEVDANAHTAPLNANALAKFDRLLDINLVYDSGAIQIYQLGGNVREP
ncbi:MAG TPA: hypothetical protein VIL85_24360 [Thermomicrobiales bacterium]|jgi:hypothetical protein